MEMTVFDVNNISVLASTKASPACPVFMQEGSGVFVVDFVPEKGAQKRRREGEAKEKVKIHLFADTKRASNGRDGFTGQKTDAGPLDISPVNISICIGHL